MARDRSRGGDVSGETRIDVTMGEAIPVASASFDPGYEMDGSLNVGSGTSQKPARVTKADLVRGYTDYGLGVGE